MSTINHSHNITQDISETGKPQFTSLVVKSIPDTITTGPDDGELQIITNDGDESFTYSFGSPSVLNGDIEFRFHHSTLGSILLETFRHNNKESHIPEIKNELMSCLSAGNAFAVPNGTSTIGITTHTPTYFTIKDGLYSSEGTNVLLSDTTVGHGVNSMQFETPKVLIPERIYARYSRLEGQRLKNSEWRLIYLIAKGREDHISFILKNKNIVDSSISLKKYLISTKDGDSDVVVDSEIIAGTNSSCAQVKVFNYSDVGGVTDDRVEQSLLSNLSGLVSESVPNGTTYWQTFRWESGKALSRFVVIGRSSDIDVEILPIVKIYSGSGTGGPLIGTFDTRTSPTPYNKTLNRLVVRGSSPLALTNGNTYTFEIGNQTPAADLRIAVIAYSVEEYTALGYTNNLTGNKLILYEMESRTVPTNRVGIFVRSVPDVNSYTELIIDHAQTNPINIYAGNGIDPVIADLGGEIYDSSDLTSYPLSVNKEFGGLVLHESDLALHTLGDTRINGVLEADGDSSSTFKVGDNDSSGCRIVRYWGTNSPDPNNQLGLYDDKGPKFVLGSSTAHGYGEDVISEGIEIYGSSVSDDVLSGTSYGSNFLTSSGIRIGNKEGSETERTIFEVDPGRLVWQDVSQTDLNLLIDDVGMSYRPSASASSLLELNLSDGLLIRDQIQSETGEIYGKKIIGGTWYRVVNIDGATNEHVGFQIISKISTENRGGFAHYCFSGVPTSNAVYFEHDFYFGDESSNFRVVAFDANGGVPPQSWDIYVYGPSPLDVSRVKIVSSDVAPVWVNEGVGMWPSSYPTGSNLVFDSADPMTYPPVSDGSFLGLSDTPSSYTTPNSIYRVNGGGNGVEEVNCQITFPASNQFKLTSGATDLTVQTSCLIDQNLQSTSNVTFNQVNVTDKLTVGGLIDPSGLVLNPQPANPETINPQNSIWIDSSGSGSYRFGNTVQIDQSLSVGDAPTFKDMTLTKNGIPTLKLYKAGQNSKLIIRNRDEIFSQIVHTSEAGSSGRLDIDCRVKDNTSGSKIRVNRGLNTTGTALVDFYKGDGTSTVTLEIDCASGDLSTVGSISVDSIGGYTSAKSLSIGDLSLSGSTLKFGNTVDDEDKLVHFQGKQSVSLCLETDTDNVGESDVPHIALLHDDRRMGNLLRGDATNNFLIQHGRVDGELASGNLIITVNATYTDAVPPSIIDNGTEAIRIYGNGANVGVCYFPVGITFDDATTTITGFKNEPDMFSNDPSAVASQQSIKTYVDNHECVTVSSGTHVTNWSSDAWGGSFAGDFDYYKIGNKVTLMLTTNSRNSTGTGDDAITMDTTLPANLQPDVEIRDNIFTTNGGKTGFGVIVITVLGNIIITKDAGLGPFQQDGSNTGYYSKAITYISS